MNNQYAVRGFTLIELMIVVAILGIISAIAFPSYQENVAKSRRADVKSVLTENAQLMERFYTENNRYDQNLAGTAPVLTVLVSPRSATGTSVMYNITIAIIPQALPVQSSYTLTATPANSMTSDRCGAFTLNNFAARNNTGAGAAISAECWR